MQDSHEDIIKDLYTLDPSLKNDDAVVRALVSELTAAKPVVVIDEQFVLRLKEKLVAAPRAVPSAALIPSPWLRYFAPVAAFAVVVLMILPSLDTVQAPTSAPAPVMDSEVQQEMFMDEASDGVMKRSGGAGIEEASMMMMSDAPAAESSMMESSFIVNVQSPGTTVTVEYVTVAAPSYLVIHEAVDGELGPVVGVSEVLVGGSFEQVLVPLSTATVQEGMYFVALYGDDGDGVFTLETDFLLYDAYGTAPLSQLFMTVLPEVQ